MPRRIYLSPPDIGALERRFLLDALDSNWIAPLGPHVDAFESEFASSMGAQHALALASGTAALHLALVVLGVERGDVVVMPTLTFAATAYAASYVGAVPRFVDCAPDTWTIDPALLEVELRTLRDRGARVGAVVTVDLYGVPCDYDPIEDVCRRFEVPVVVDAAEAVGSLYKGKSSGLRGSCAAYSFNGNKIITTSGGGMLVSSDPAFVARARHLSAQARQPTVHFEHADIGFNYRMSNLLAAVGRGQLTSLPEKIERRREIGTEYRRVFQGVAGVSFLSEPSYARSNGWLTCIMVNPAAAGVTREDLRLHLEACNIESRPVWKPMHLQPIFRHNEHRSAPIAEEFFEHGLCLPSGSSLTPADQALVVEALFERLGCRQPGRTERFA
jgi:pyridoxal phosphate-dependent aminotransferase EpsN